MCRDGRNVSLGAPNVKCVDENYITHEVMIRAVPVSIAYPPD